MIKNDLNKEITITHTPTSFFLLKKSPDAFTLYHFYCYTASWQEDGLIYATRGFVEKALGWGNERYHKAKNILIKSNIISDEQIKDEEGKIEGNFIWIRTIKPEEENHLSYPPQVDGKTPNNTIIKEKGNIPKPIIKTTDDLEEEFSSTGGLPPEELQRLQMKKELRAKKKNPFIISGSRFTPKTFTPKRKAGTHAEHIR